MRRLAYVVPCVIALTPATAGAREARVSLGFETGFLIWGAAAAKGVPANPTGGFMLAPFVRVALPVPRLDWLNIEYTQSPMVIAPFTDQMGFLDANDIGLAVRHGGATAALAVTVAPLYATFCNASWCYPEALIAWGGTARGSLELGRDAQGRALHVFIAARVLYAQPTAWTWPGLDPELRRVVPTGTMITAGGAWSW